MPKKKRGSKPKPKQDPTDDGYPKVSILTPLYNRNKWLPLMMANVCHFNYDKKKLEWFILDSKDGEEDIKLFNKHVTTLGQKHLLLDLEVSHAA